MQLNARGAAWILSLTLLAGPALSRAGESVDIDPGPLPQEITDLYDNPNNQTEGDLTSDNAEPDLSLTGSDSESTSAEEAIPPDPEAQSALD